MKIIKTIKKYTDRYINKSIAFILSVAFFISVIAIPSYAVIDKAVGNKTCLEHHFEIVGLDTYSNDYPVPPNTVGSCGYVAMSMLLSYYDTYWENRFVPEHLEWNEGTYNSSTDVLTSTFTASNENLALKNGQAEDSGYTFTNFVDEYRYMFLQEHLIYMDRYNNPLLLAPNFFAILDGTMYNTLRNYLYDECGFTENEVVVRIMRESESSDAALFNVMKEQINKGNPVIYFGAEYEFNPDSLDVTDWVGAHYMIAYDVDMNNGVEDIKLNAGWNTTQSQKTKWVNTCEYAELNSIIWIEINEESLPHRCDDNYLDTVTEEYICSCEIYRCTHPAGTHSMGTDYVSYVSSGHYLACVRCGYQKIENHNITHVPCNSNDYHKDICACGFETTSPHVISSTSGGIGTCMICGASVDLRGPGSGTIMPWGSNGGINEAYVVSNNIQYITANGSYILPNGVIVLVDEDIEAYFNGVLEFFDPSEELEIS